MGSSPIFRAIFFENRTIGSATKRCLVYWGLEQWSVRQALTLEIGVRLSYPQPQFLHAFTIDATSNLFSSPPILEEFESASSIYSPLVYPIFGQKRFMTHSYFSYINERSGYMTTKICTKCKLELPIEEFHWRNKAAGTRRSECKKCHNATMRKDYDKKRE